jgi:hypothetical protein|tara:strand:- start:7103 stop:7321 length:219 start_codon:yes stop_codon:yes gene_type:complete
MKFNKEFADIVHNSLGEVDELGDDILLEEEVLQPRMFRDQMPPLAFPFGYMIISSTFMFYEDDEDENGNEEF